MTPQRVRVRVGIVGLGEIGHGLAAGLRDAGLDAVVVLQRDAGRPHIQARLRESGARLAGAPAELADGADVILVTTTGEQALTVAEELAGVVGPRHLYVDLTSASPGIARLVGHLVTAAGARAVDGALMGSTLQFGAAVPIMASGPGATDFVRLLEPWGMRIRAIGPEVGQAASIKTLRHTLMKGQIALLIESLAGAERLGIAEPLLDSVAEWYDSVPFRINASRVVRTTAVHAHRRRAEVAEAAALLAEAGVDPAMTRAAAEVLHRIDALGLGLTEVPESLEAAVRLLIPAVDLTGRPIDEPLTGR